MVSAPRTPRVGSGGARTLGGEGVTGHLRQVDVCVGCSTRTSTKRFRRGVDRAGRDVHRRGIPLGIPGRVPLVPGWVREGEDVRGSEWGRHWSVGVTSVVRWEGCTGCVRSKDPGRRSLVPDRGTTRPQGVRHRKGLSKAGGRRSGQGPY